MRTAIIILLLCGCMSIAMGQSSKLRVSSNFLSGTKYYLADQRIDKSEVAEVLVEHQQAYTHFAEANRSFGTSKVFSSIGGFLVGWELGKFIAGRENNVIVPFVAAGVLIIAIPIHSSGARKMKKAVDVYNNEPLGAIPMNVDEGTDFTLIGAFGGVGLRLHF